VTTHLGGQPLTSGATRDYTDATAPGNVSDYLSDELGFGRLLDFGLIVPRLQQLYEWSSHGLGARGLLDCTRDGALTYGWPFADRELWRPGKTFLPQMAHRAFPPERLVVTR
jgi:hypothetical protein